MNKLVLKIRLYLFNEIHDFMNFINFCKGKLE